MFRTVAAAVLLAAGSAKAELYADTTFGNAGFVDVAISDVPYFQRPTVLVQPDHRVVVAVVPEPTVQTPPLQMRIVRLLPDGSRDTAFGANGIAALPLTSQPVQYGYVTDLQRQADGRLLVMVWMSRPGTPPAPGGTPVDILEQLLLRLNDDGSPDATFNAGQPVVLSSGTQSLALKLLPPQADGGLLLVFTNGNERFRARRLRADGSADTAFGSGGELIVTQPGSISSDVMSLPGGGLQVLHRSAYGSPPRNFWRRYRGDGSLDTAFGNGGEQELILTESLPMESVGALGDGTVLGWRGSCPMRLFDAEGRVLSYLATCPDLLYTGGFRPQRYGEKLLFSGIINGFSATSAPDGGPTGLFLHVTDRRGVLDRGFTASVDGRWRPPDQSSAPYMAAADGGDRIVLVRPDDNGLRVWRYRDLRGSDPLSRPVPALKPAASALLLAMLAIAGLFVVRRRAA